MLSDQAGTSIWLKLETEQPTGSFKIRGIGLACAEKSQRGARRFICSSGGNAGIAAAYAGRQLAVPVIVVVPETTTARAITLIRREGAEVIVQGASWQEANDYALEMVTERDAYLHPFDDPLVWQGHASIVDEVVQSPLKPDAIVLSVGGGGLLSGVVAFIIHIIQAIQGAGFEVFLMGLGMFVFLDEYAAGQDAQLAALVVFGIMAIQFALVFYKLHRTSLLFFAYLFCLVSFLFP